MPPQPKVFETSRHGNVLVVTPVATKTSYRYQDVHLESNSVTRLLDDPELVHVVVDLNRINYAGSVVIGALVRMARKITEDGGRVAFCCVTEGMDDILRKMGLFRLWTKCETLDEALQLVAGGGEE